MKKIVGASLASLLMSGTALALPVEEAVRTALQTNPDMGVAVEGRRATDYELRQSEARYLPSVDFNAGFGHEYTNDPSTRSLRSINNGEPYKTMNRYESSLALTQIIFDGYATDSEVARQEARVVSAARRVKETSEFIALDAVQAYLEARRQRELTELSEENVAVHQETLELVNRKLDGGAATVADQQQAESRLATAEAALEDARARLRDADAAYSRVVGENPDDLERPVAPFWAMPQSVDEAIDWAIQNNPTVTVVKSDLEASFREFDAAKANFFPRVTFEAGVDANRNVSGVRGQDFNAQAMIRMSYNLYRGGEDTYRRKEALARIAEARQLYNRAVRLTEEEMRLAWNARDSSVTRVKAQRREVEANDIVRRTYRAQFDVGGRNLLELLDSENEYFFARTNLISTEFQAMFGVYRVLATGGVLLNAMGVSEPSEANTEYDPIERLDVDLEAKETQSLTVDEVLGEDTVGGDELDPNADGLELDPSSEGEELDPSAMAPSVDTTETAAVIEPELEAAASANFAEISPSVEELSSVSVEAPVEASVAAEQPVIVAAESISDLPVVDYGSFGTAEAVAPSEIFAPEEQVFN